MRLKVVLIEENRQELRELTERIDWNALDCDIAGTADDGQEALDVLARTQPDMVITGLSLPDTDGLSLIAQARTLLPDCRFLILTAQRGFEQVRSALRFGVCDYLLKPMQPDEVTGAVRRAALGIYRQQAENADLRQIDKLRWQTQLLVLLTNDLQKGLGVQQMLDDARLGFNAYYIMVIQLHKQKGYTQQALNTIDSVFEQHAVKAVPILLYDSVVAFVMRDTEEGWREEATVLARLIVDKLNPNLSIGVSQLQTSHYAIRQAYFQARQTLWEFALEKQHTLPGFYTDITKSSHSGERIGETHRRINELVEKAELTDESAVEAAKALFELSGHQYSNLRAMISLYMMALQKKFDVSPDQNVDSALKNTWYVSGEEDAQKCLLAVTKALRDITGKTGTSRLISNAVRYINLHAVEGATLKEVAAKMNVTTNYLSQLIRRETGVSFHEYVLRAKMAVARSMLADPRILVDDVAHAIGYSNYLSFYNAFKRSENMTPTEYRRLHT